MVTRIVILGGGPAGYEAALVAATSHPDTAHVTVIDSDGIGGAAVLDDCVPSKTFIASTGLRTELRRAPRLGFDIDIDDAKISLPQIHARVKTPGRRTVGRHRRPAAQRGCRRVAGRGELVDPTPGLAHHRIKATAADGTTSEHEADVVLIATGASPRILPSAQPDGERILTWRQLYDLEALPEHLIVVGSGVTGAEFVQRLHRAGRAGDRGGQPGPGAAVRGRRRRAGAGRVVRRTRRQAGQERPRGIGHPHRRPASW